MFRLKFGLSLILQKQFKSYFYKTDFLRQNINFDVPRLRITMLRK